MEADVCLGNVLTGEKEVYAISEAGISSSTTATSSTTASNLLPQIRVRPSVYDAATKKNRPFRLPAACEEQEPPITEADNKEITRATLPASHLIQIARCSRDILVPLSQQSLPCLHISPVLCEMSTASFVPSQPLTLANLQIDFAKTNEIMAQKLQCASDVSAQKEIRNLKRQLASHHDELEHLRAELIATKSAARCRLEQLQQTTIQDLVAASG